MSIPSIIVFEELKKEVFSKVPARNAFGELYIGYGHRLLDSKIFFIKEASCLKKNISNHMDYEKESLIFAENFCITEEEASALLIKDIMFHYDTLSSYCLAFRRLCNACTSAILHAESQFGVYYRELTSLNFNHLPSVHISKPFKRKLKKNEKEEKILLPLPNRLSLAESALVRLDVLIFMLHTIGKKRFFAMKKVFESIAVNNFVEAASYMLGYSWGEVLKEKAVICAMRMKYGRIIRDAILDVPDEKEYAYKQSIGSDIEDDFVDDWRDELEDDFACSEADIQTDFIPVNSHIFEKQDRTLRRTTLEYA